MNFTFCLQIYDILLLIELLFIKFSKYFFIVPAFLTKFYISEIFDWFQSIFRENYYFISEFCGICTSYHWFILSEGFLKNVKKGNSWSDIWINLQILSKNLWLHICWKVYMILAIMVYFRQSATFPNLISLLCLRILIKWLKSSISKIQLLSSL